MAESGPTHPPAERNPRRFKSGPWLFYLSYCEDEKFVVGLNPETSEAKSLRFKSGPWLFCLNDSEDEKHCGGI